jgi:hypothetical protein
MPAAIASGRKDRRLGPPEGLEFMVIFFSSTEIQRKATLL